MAHNSGMVRGLIILAPFAFATACSRAPNSQDSAHLSGGKGGTESVGTAGAEQTLSGAGGAHVGAAGSSGSAATNGGGAAGATAVGHGGSGVVGQAGSGVVGQAGSGVVGQAGNASVGGSGGMESAGGNGGMRPNVSFATSFDANESPLSDGGRWKHNNPWFTRVVTNAGNASGTAPNPQNSGKYEDSYAFLGGMGFPPNQYASGHIHKGASSGYLEVELLLRFSDTNNSTRGYECFLHQSGEYVSIARWKGGPLGGPAAVGYFDILGGASNVMPPKDGDLFEAQIVGNIITVKLAGATIASVDVAKFDGTVIESGDPGIGFDAGASGSESPNSSYGFQDFSAKGL
jgi:hypothetical protein